MADDDPGPTDPDGLDARRRVDEDEDEDTVTEAAYELLAIRGAARILQVVAVLAGLLWAVAVVTVFWFQWDLTKNDSGGSIVTGSVDNNRVAQTVAATLASTWGYAIVAVLAYVGATMLRGQRLRLLVAAMADDT